MFTRRELLRLGAGGGALLSGRQLFPAQLPYCSVPNLDVSKAQHCVPNEKSTKPRRSAFDIQSDADYTNRLCAAFSAIRGGTSCLFGWASGQHCDHCYGKCNGGGTNIHQNWAFLPWHRGLLYIVERGLRQTPGNDDLRLPYWDWETPNHATVPPVFSNCAGLKADFDRGLFTPPSADSIAQSLSQLGFTDFALFGGTAQPSTNGPPVAGGAHATVHSGFSSQSPMSSMITAAADPLFYSHHGNVDRLWASWKGTKPVFPTADENRFYFYDVSNGWQYIRFADLADETKLGYTYASTVANTPSPAHHQTLLLEKNGRKGPAGLIQGLSKPQAGRRFLVITGFQTQGLKTSYLQFGVFDAQVAKGVVAPQSKSYLGTIYGLAYTKEGRIDGERLSAILDVTEKLLPDSFVKTGTLPLFVAPLGRDGETLDETRPLAANRIEFVS